MKKFVSFTCANILIPNTLPLVVQEDPLPVMTPPPTPVAPEPIRKNEWKLTLGNRDDPAAFLQRLDKISISKVIDKDRRMPCLSELLTREPALWFRNNRTG